MTYWKPFIKRILILFLSVSLAVSVPCACHRATDPTPMLTEAEAEALSKPYETFDALLSGGSSFICTARWVRNETISKGSLYGNADWRYGVFSIDTMMKESTPWPYAEIAVSLDLEDRNIRLNGQTTYLLFLQGVDLAIYPKSILLPVAILPLTEQGAVDAASEPLMVWPVAEVAMDPGFYADPVSFIRASDGISGAPLHPYIPVRQQYPDRSSMALDADLILLTRLDDPDPCLFDAQRCAIDPGQVVLFNKTGQLPPAHVVIPFLPEQGVEYVLFLRELEPGEYDLCARDGAVLEKSEIADWDAFVQLVADMTK